MRAALRDEFAEIYVVNLRGDAYKSGEEFRKEGEKLFGGGSRNGVQITVLVSNPGRDLSEPATLHYAAVPEYSTLEQKFAWLAELGDVTGDRFEVVPVNDRHDWVNLTDGTFEQLLPICSTNGIVQQTGLSATYESALGVLPAVQMCTCLLVLPRRPHRQDRSIHRGLRGCALFCGGGRYLTFEEGHPEHRPGKVIKWTARP